MMGLLRAAFDASSSGIMVLDTAARIVLWNRWLESRSGYSAEQCQGRCLAEIFPELVVSRVYQAIDAARIHGLSSVVSQTIHRAPFPLFRNQKARQAGERIPHRVEVKAVMAEGGTRYCLIEIADVTPAVARDQFLRKQAQELAQSLRWAQESEARHRAVLDTAVDGIVTINVDGTIERFNRAAEYIFGYSAAEAVNLNFQVLLDDPLQLDIAALEIAQSEGAVVDACVSREIMGRRRSGHAVPLDVTVSRTQVGATALITVIMRDISSRKASEAALRESERRFRTIADVAPVLLWLSDTSGGCIYFNAPWLAFTGREIHEILGDGWSRDVHRDDVVRCLETYSKAFELRAPFEMEYRLRRNDGEYRWVLDKGVPRYTNQGVFLGYVGSCIDISERHNAEDALRRAGDFAIRYARAKAEFVANMSHELRTPMNGVLGMLGLLGLTPLQAEQRDYLEVAQRSGNALLDIINNVLDFSKLEAGGVRLEQIEYDPREIAEDVVELLASQAAAKNIDLICDLPAGLPDAARGDPGRLRQLLLNLVANAVKFTEHGEVILKAAVLDSPTAVGMDQQQSLTLRFEVRDTGIGISQDALTHIFDHFTQADASTTRRYGGTGLGLAISRQLVELMGGKIGVTSQLDVGSVFWIELPCEIVARDAYATAGECDLKGRHVLLVGALGRQEFALLEQLELLGTQVSKVSTIEAAHALLQNAANAAFDVVLVSREDEGWSQAAARSTGYPSFGQKDLACLLLTRRELGEGAPERLRQSGYAGVLKLPCRLSLLRTRLLTTLGRLPAVAVPSRFARGQGARILVVDDVEINRRVACGMLRQCGYQTDAVGSGVEALRAMEVHDYALVFMDCQMPGMDGYKTTAAMRSSPRGRDVAIVALTASALDGSEARCLAAGMNDYLAKPFRIEQIEAMAERWVQAGLPQRQDMPSVPPVPGGATDLAALPAVDKVALAALQDLLGPADFAAVVTAFLNESENRCRTLRAALRARDLATVVQVAHALKGASGNMAAPRLGALCRELESHTRTGKWEAGLFVIEHMFLELSELQRAIGEEITA